MVTLIRYIIRGWFSPTQATLDRKTIQKIQERAESYRVPPQRKATEDDWF